MSEPSAADIFVLDMLGEPLKSAVLGARERTGDPTIMARISAGQAHVERGGHDPTEGATVEDAAAYLATLT